MSGEEYATATRILVIEDDRPIRRFLEAALTNDGYEVVEAETGRLGLTHLLARVPDLVILDLGLPDMDGMDIIARVREWSQVPIVILSARGREDDKVRRAERRRRRLPDQAVRRARTARPHAGGATARGRAPRGGRGGDASRFQAGDLVVDLAARRVFVREAEVHLTPLEYRLLTTLVKNAGKVLTHRYLLQEVWGPGYAEQTHYPRMFIASLRRKIEDDPAEPRYILTEQGVGYRLVED